MLRYVVNHDLWLCLWGCFWEGSALEPAAGVQQYLLHAVGVMQCAEGQARTERGARWALTTAWPSQRIAVSWLPHSWLSSFNWYSNWNLHIYSDQNVYYQPSSSKDFELHPHLSWASSLQTKTMELLSLHNHVNQLFMYICVSPMGSVSDQYSHLTLSMNSCSHWSHTEHQQRFPLQPKSSVPKDLSKGTVSYYFILSVMWMSSFCTFLLGKYKHYC